MGRLSLILLVIVTCFLAGCDSANRPPVGVKNSDQPQQLEVKKNDQVANNEEKVSDKEANDRKEKYFKIWKDIFLIKNNLNQDFFDKNIKINNYRLEKWNSGEAFSVDYTVTHEIVGWNKITEKLIDNFTIKIFSSSEEYRHLNLPRDTYFEKDDIKVVVENYVYNTIINLVPDTYKLKFTNFEEAQNSFRRTLKDNIYTIDLVINQELIDRFIKDVEDNKIGLTNGLRICNTSNNPRSNNTYACTSVRDSSRCDDKNIFTEATLDLGTGSIKIFQNVCVIIN
jgi:hypothetical protein